MLPCLSCKSSLTSIDIVPNIASFRQGKYMRSVTIQVHSFNFIISKTTRFVGKVHALQYICSFLSAAFSNIFMADKYWTSYIHWHMQKGAEISVQRVSYYPVLTKILASIRQTLEPEWSIYITSSYFEPPGFKSAGKALIITGDFRIFLHPLQAHLG